jgi:hypothetical protein
LYQAGISIPYSDEYKIQPPNAGLLSHIANRTGGEVVSTAEQAMRDIQYESSESKSIQQWLVLLAMLLFFIDITLRRFGYRMLSRIPSMLIKQKSNEGESPVQTNVSQLLKGKRKR